MRGSERREHRARRIDFGGEYAAEKGGGKAKGSSKGGGRGKCAATYPSFWGRAAGKPAGT